jgi:LmbE family N-acetylglucosaminyl deacetylase
MSCDVIFLSPHADDVAFSCPNTVHDLVTAGKKVAVVTVFEADANGPFADAPRRRTEDKTFAEAFGVTGVSVGLRDAIVRHARYKKLTALFSQPLAEDEALIDRVDAAIAPLMDEHTQLWAPLGVGGHVDHRLTHQFGRALGATHFYEDMPYALLRYAVGRRLHELGFEVLDAQGIERASAFTEWSAATRAYRRMPLLQSLTSSVTRPFAAWTMARAVCQIAEPPAEPTAVECVTNEVADWDRIAQITAIRRRALDCYPSQWPYFYPTQAAWIDALSRYSLKIGTSPLAERSFVMR